MASVTGIDSTSWTLYTLAAEAGMLNPLRMENIGTKDHLNCLSKKKCIANGRHLEVDIFTPSFVNEMLDIIIQFLLKSVDSCSVKNKS